jgi:hypothetical protein
LPFIKVIIRGDQNWLKEEEKEEDQFVVYSKQCLEV